MHFLRLDYSLREQVRSYSYPRALVGVDRAKTPKARLLKHCLRVYSFTNRGST